LLSRNPTAPPNQVRLQPAVGVSEERALKMFG
jgi:hypothetical protein